MLPTSFTLNEEQKEFVLKNYSTMDVGSMARALFGETDSNGKRIMANSAPGRAIKIFLAGMDKPILLAETVNSPPPLELTDEQKSAVDQLANRIDNTTELTRLVFNDPKLKPQGAEWRATWKYLKEVYPDRINVSEDPVEDVEYSPPTSLLTLVGILNNYVTTGDSTRKAYNWGKLKMSEERQIRALMSYIRNYRFKYVACQMQKQVDRELFISTFMRWAHDKPDLTQMEVDTMISAAEETVNVAQIGRSVQQLDKYHEEIMAQGGEIEEGGKKRRFGMTDVELINAIRSKHDLAKRRLADLMKNLETSRSERIKEKDGRNATVINILDEWMKDERKRNDMLEIGIKEHEEDAREVGRLRDMDDMTALIAGQSEDEAVN